MTSRPQTARPKDIVIIGGGIIGTSAAYYLSRHPFYDPKIHTITLLEATSIASNSSGKGGGFIAEWATPRCLAPLSFKLHRELAEEHGGEKIWGYRSVFAAEVKLLGQDSGTYGTHGPKNLGCAPEALDWLRPGSLQQYDEIGGPSNSGQVNPYVFTTMLARLSEAKGVALLVGCSVTQINVHNEKNDVESVSYFKDGITNTVQATDVVVAAGPWTPKLVPNLSLLTPRGHSVIVKPTRPLSPYILFPDIRPAPDSSVESYISPDIYPRPADELYTLDTVFASGPDDYEQEMPSNSAQVELVDKKLSDVLLAVGSVSDEISKGEVIKWQACYKAQIRKHEEEEEVGPMVGPGESKGLWIATGHDEWGIQNGPATGLVMSEMILEGKARSADCSSLDPKHFLKCLRRFET